MNSSLNVVICAPIMGDDLDPVRSVDPSINVLDGNAAFISWNRARRKSDSTTIEAAEREMHSVLAQAEMHC